MSDIKINYKREKDGSCKLDYTTFKDIDYSFTAFHLGSTVCTELPNLKAKNFSFRGRIGDAFDLIKNGDTDYVINDALDNLSVFPIKFIPIKFGDDTSSKMITDNYKLIKKNIDKLVYTVKYGIRIYKNRYENRRFYSPIRSDGTFESSEIYNLDGKYDILLFDSEDEANDYLQKMLHNVLSLCRNHSVAAIRNMLNIYSIEYALFVNICEALYSRSPIENIEIFQILAIPNDNDSISFLQNNNIQCVVDNNLRSKNMHLQTKLLPPYNFKMQTPCSDYIDYKQQISDFGFVLLSNRAAFYMYDKQHREILNKFYLKAIEQHGQCKVGDVITADDTKCRNHAKLTVTNITRLHDLDTPTIYFKLEKEHY